MRRIIRSISGIAIVISLLLASATACTADSSTSGIYLDDDSSPHEPYIEALAAAGITQGCNPPVNNRYCPNQPVTRGQMAAFLTRALNLTDSGGGDWFTDDNTSTFEVSIDKLATAGITQGCNPPSNDHYCPNQPVTRGQMAVFLARALNLTDDGGGDWFTDDNGSVAEDSIDKLATAGITQGCNPPTNDRYCPDAPVTRGQMASFLARALSLPPWAHHHFGPGLFFNDNNVNLHVRRVDSTDTKVLQSFRAPKSGDLTGVRVYLVGGEGYASGTGGLLEVNVWPADGVPLRPDRTGEPLSTGRLQLTRTHNVRPSLEASWPMISLTATQPLEAGALYVVEFKNVDPDPVNNWVSVNGLAALKEHQTVARYLPVSDWSMTYEWETSDGSTYHDLSSQISPPLDPGLYYFPSAEYQYQDGTVFGYVRLEQGNFDPWWDDDSYPFDVDSNSPVRERLNIQEGTTITGAEIHASTKVAGDLRVLFHLDGETVATATLSEPTATFYTSGPNNNGVYDWHSIDLGADSFAVSAGDTLDVEMVAVGSSVWVMSADRTGIDSAVNFSRTTTYGDSSAQKWTGSTWVNTLYYDKECGSCPFGTSHFRVILMASNAS